MADMESGGSSNKSKRRVAINIAPTLVVLATAATLLPVTVLYYMQEDRCGARERGPPVCISTFLCCNPGYWVGVVGLTIVSLLLAALIAPLWSSIAHKWDRAYPRTVAAICAVGLALAAAGLQAFAIINACDHFESHSDAGNVFFFGALLFAFVYNGWHLYHEFGPGVVSATRLALARVFVSVLTVCCFITEYIITYSMEGAARQKPWLANLWVLITAFLMQLLLVQTDLLVPETADAAAGRPLRGGEPQS